MSVNMNRRLQAADVEHFSSPYLSNGRKQEAWQIDDIEIHGNQLTATVSMRSTYVSCTDSRGFHLTIFSTLEFLSQLFIIYGHIWAGLPKKTKEGWMVESTTRSVRAIRNPENIRVEMNVTSMRKLGENLYSVADFRVTDDQGGLFEVTLKGFLA